MSTAQQDRNLLFGIVALQFDFVTRDALIAAMNAWVLDKKKPLADLLVEREARTPSRRAMLEPLVEQLQRGLDQGFFHDIDPLTEAQSGQGVVWASTERQWAAGDCERADVREHALRFCLRGLGVAPDNPPGN